MSELSCPYTGKKVTAEHIQGRGWIAKGAFSIGTPMKVSKDVYEIVLRRRGLSCLPASGALVCPYRGTPLEIVETPNGFVAKGGFDSARAFASRDELVTAFTMRAGRVNPDAVCAVVARPVEPIMATRPAPFRKAPTGRAVEKIDRELHALRKTEG
jgi:hypothetical protein